MASSWSLVIGLTGSMARTIGGDRAPSSRPCRSRPSTCRGPSLQAWAAIGQSARRTAARANNRCRIAWRQPDMGTRLPSQIRGLLDWPFLHAASMFFDEGCEFSRPSQLGAEGVNLDDMPSQLVLGSQQEDRLVLGDETSRVLDAVVVGASMLHQFSSSFLEP